MLDNSHQGERTIKGGVKYSRENSCVSLAVEFLQTKGVELLQTKGNDIWKGMEYFHVFYVNWLVSIFQLVNIIYSNYLSMPTHGRKLEYF